MKKKLLALAVVMGTALTAWAQLTMDVNTKKMGAPIQSTMYGIFFEDINYTADGRLYGELVTNLGSLMTPQAAYMETLGLDTLDIRYRRQAETTLWLAQQCQQLPEIKRVNYTGLEDNPFHELSEAQFGPLPGAVFTIDLESKEAAWAFIDKLQVIRRATNLFDRKSLAIHPASTIFGLFTAEQCAEMSVPDTTVRLSIGLEAGEDLLEDIKQAVK